MAEKIAAKAVGRVVSIETQDEIGMAYVWNTGEIEVSFYDSEAVIRFQKELATELETDTGQTIS